MKRFWSGIVLLSMILTAGCSLMKLNVDSGKGGQLSFSQPTFNITTPTTTASPTHVPTQTQTAFLPSTPFPSATPIPSATASLTPDPNLTFYGPGPVMAPILMYHRVLPYASGSEYVVTTEQFKRQMQWLQEQGYQTITVADLVEAVRVGKYLPLKPIILTFDDGYRDVYQNAYPILQAAGYTATMYLIEKSLNEGGNLTDAIIEELSEAGWEFGNHSATHAHLPTSKNMVDEVCTSRTRLVEKYGLPFDSFAYPYATRDEKSIQAVIDCGYTSGAGNGSFTIHVEERLFFLSRREIKSYFDLQRFITTVTDVR